MEKMNNSSISLICDSCGREVFSCNIVNGMKFCAKCYQETFGNKNMTENLNNMYDAYLKILNEKDQRIAELEEQLKKSQNQKAIEELEKLKDFFLEPYGDEKMGTEFLITTKNTGKIAEYVLDRIKSLKGE